MPLPVDILFCMTGDARRNSRALRQLRALSGAGWRVHVLCTGDASASVWPLDGVGVTFLPAQPGNGPAFFRRNSASFLDAARKLPAHVYHASDLFVLPAMAKAARAHGSKLVYDARELYPHAAGTAGKPWAKLFWYLLERRYARTADLVLTVNGTIANWMQRHYGIALPFVLPNVPPRREVPRTSYLRSTFPVEEGHCLFLYQGLLSKGRGCELALQSIAAVPNAALVFLGDGPLKAQLESQRASLNLETRVFFHDFVAPDDLLSVTASADVGLCLIEDVSLSYRYSLPNKLFEYLMAGVPVLGSHFPEITRVVKGYGVGRSSALTVSAVSEAMSALVQAPDDRALMASRTGSVFEDEFNWAQASERFITVYRDRCFR